MRGQNTIIRMRLHGLRPALVWLLVLESKPPRGQFHDAEIVLENGGLPEVHIGIDDIAGTLDFRFLTGLTVLLQGTDVPRLREVFARLKEFGPERIITSTGEFINDYRVAA